MQTICPAYDGSVRTSWYPDIDVLKTISPHASAAAPHARPRKALPSSSTSSAGLFSPVVIDSRVTHFHSASTYLRWTRAAAYAPAQAGAIVSATTQRKMVISRSVIETTQTGTRQSHTPQRHVRS